MASQPRVVLRKAPPVAAEAAVASTAQAPSDVPAFNRDDAQDGEPYCLLDATTWQMCPQAAARALTAGHSFCVTGVLGAQGLGKSAFLNRLLGFEGELSAAGPHPTSAFPVWRGLSNGRQAEQQLWQHCTRGIMVRCSGDGHVALDTQPLFSASVLADMAAQWEQQPPAALAAPAVAAAGEGKAAAVPYEGVQALSQLQIAVLLLSTCNRLLVWCEGVGDGARLTWDFLLTAEMLARGIPDPSMPPQQPLPPQPSAAASGAAVAGGAPLPRPAPPQEHLAEVILVHVVPAGSGDAIAAQLQQLESQLDAYFASSRLCRPGPLRMLEAIGRGDGAPGSSRLEEGVSYWVLPALPGGITCTAGNSAAWDGLVAQLLARPWPSFDRRVSQQQWLRGVVGDCWRAVRKSTDIATFYSRLARTQFKGAAGWALGRP